MIIVLTTTSSIEEAETLARRIVEEKLAACVQILPRMTSVYFWEGEVRKESEYLLLIKTLGEKFDKLRDFVQANHSYAVPEIVAIPAVRISEDYMNWLADYLK